MHNSYSSHDNFNYLCAMDESQSYAMPQQQNNMGIFDPSFMGHFSVQNDTFQNAMRRSHFGVEIESTPHRDSMYFPPSLGLHNSQVMGPGKIRFAEFDQRKPDRHHKDHRFEPTVVQNAGPNIIPNVSKRNRGRPRKDSNPVRHSMVPIASQKRGRGRPRKDGLPSGSVPKSLPTKRGRGRPRKTVAEPGFIPTNRLPERGLTMNPSFGIPVYGNPVYGNSVLGHRALGNPTIRDSANNNHAVDNYAVGNRNLSIGDNSIGIPSVANSAVGNTLGFHLDLERQCGAC